jgi:hypothetical protein
MKYLVYYIYIFEKKKTHTADFEFVRREVEEGETKEKFSHT